MNQGATKLFVGDVEIKSLPDLTRPTVLGGRLSGADHSARYLYDLLRLFHCGNQRGAPMATVANTVANYLDESGVHEGSPYCVMGGFLGGADDWVNLSSDWNKILRLPEFSVTQFHSTECWAQRGEFSGWSVERRIGLVNALIELLLPLDVYGYAVAVSAPSYSRILAPHIHPLMGKPYFICLFGCVERMCVLASEHFPSAENVVVFADQNQELQEHGQILYRATRRIMRERAEKLDEELHYGSRTKLIPLQVADLMAHHTFKDLLHPLMIHPAVREPVYAAILKLKPKLAASVLMSLGKAQRAFSVGPIEQFMDGVPD